ncbi:MAG: hypothetical protein HZB39_20290 [Planctomycetes bacterium]|nr:hypothetical protein [Planctomycetota bacterium]
MKRKPTPQTHEPEPPRVASSFFRPQSTTPPEGDSDPEPEAQDWQAGETEEEAEGFVDDGYAGDPIDESTEVAGDEITDGEAPPVDPAAAAEPDAAVHLEVAPIHADPETSDWLRTAGVIIGLAALALGGLSSMLDGAARQMLVDLTEFGIGPRSLVVAGIALFTVGLVQREFARRAATETRRYQGLDRSLRLIADVVNIKSASTAPPTDALRAEFDRLDEKIANLTRATKLYGTPLLEISNQVSDLANRLQDVLAIEPKLREAIGEIGLQLAGERSGGVADGAITELKHAVEGSRDRAVEAGTLAKRAADAVDELQLELMTVMQSAQEDLRRAIGDDLAKACRTIDAATAQAGGTGGTPDLGPLTQSLAQIQRDVTALATVVARLEQRPAQVAAAPPSTAQSSPVTPMGSTLAAAPPETPAAAAATPATASTGAGDANATKIAGARQTNNKNVLGAIAKLKSMRG